MKKYYRPNIYIKDIYQIPVLKLKKQGVKALKWYQRTIYHIGVLCCLAAMIYAIFLYLRRKK